MAALAVFWKIRQICVIYYFTKATGLIWYYIGSEFHLNLLLINMKCNYCQKTPKNVGHFDFQDGRHYRGNEVMYKKNSSWFVWCFGEKKLKIYQQILILSHKISAFSAVLGAIFIHICIYMLLWLMSQNILIFCRQKMS